MSNPEEKHPILGRWYRIEAFRCERIVAVTPAGAEGVSVWDGGGTSFFRAEEPYLSRFTDETILPEGYEPAPLSRESLLRELERLERRADDVGYKLRFYLERK